MMIITIEATAMCVTPYIDSSYGGTHLDLCNRHCLCAAIDRYPAQSIAHGEI